MSEKPICRRLAFHVNANYFDAACLGRPPGSVIAVPDLINDGHGHFQSQDVLSLHHWAFLSSVCL